MNDLGSPYPPTAISVCRADPETSRTGRVPFWVKRFPQSNVTVGFSTFRLSILTRFIRTSHVFALSFRPSLLAALVLAAMTAVFRRAVSALGMSALEKEYVVTTASYVRLPFRMCR